MKKLIILLVLSVFVSGCVITPMTKSDQERFEKEEQRRLEKDRLERILPKTGRIK